MATKIVSKFTTTTKTMNRTNSNPTKSINSNNNNTTQYHHNTKTSTAASSSIQSITNNRIHNNNQEHQQQQQRFSTILVARSNHTRPTELEIQLRNHCQKIRIHTQLSGAHMIFPQEQGLAIRIYYCNSNKNNHNNDSLPSHNSNHTSTSNEETVDDPDGILDFCNNFQWSMIFFIVSDTNILNDTNSFVYKSMQLVNHFVDISETTTNNNNNTTKNHIRPPRMMVLPNTEHAIIAIMECINLITPTRCALRTQYTNHIRAINYVPNEVNESNHNSNSEKENHQPYNTNHTNNDPIYEKAMEQHYCNALREWGIRANISDGEIDVLLHVLPTLSQLVQSLNMTTSTTSNNNSNIVSLSNVPVEENTKRKLRHFFCANDNDDIDNNRNIDTNNNQNDNTSTSADTMIISPPTIQIPDQHRNNPNLYKQHKGYNTDNNEMIPMDTQHHNSNFDPPLMMTTPFGHQNNNMVNHNMYETQYPMSNTNGGQHPYPPTQQLYPPLGNDYYPPYQVQNSNGGCYDFNHHNQPTIQPLQTSESYYGQPQQSRFTAPPIHYTNNNQQPSQQIPYQQQQQHHYYQPFPLPPNHYPDRFVPESNNYSLSVASKIVPWGQQVSPRPSTNNTMGRSIPYYPPTHQSMSIQYNNSNNNNPSSYNQYNNNSNNMYPSSQSVQQQRSVSTTNMGNMAPPSFQPSQDQYQQPPPPPPQQNEYMNTMQHYHHPHPHPQQQQPQQQQNSVSGDQTVAPSVAPSLSSSNILHGRSYYRHHRQQQHQPNNNNNNNENQHLKRIVRKFM